LQLIHKDLRLALELGHDLNLSLPGAALAQQLMERVFDMSK
jgi:3-hydroxyisobutyrate dehydrogenase-like beta-hydroxyacid dehydrogenase